MTDLHLALFGLGALFVAGLALWEWRRGRRSHAQPQLEAAGQAVPSAAPAGDDWARRLEPRIDNMFDGHDSPDADHMPIHDVPVIHPAEAFAVPVARESAVDTPAAARPVARPAPPDIRWPPERADRVLTLRLVSAQGALLPGREVRLALEHAGLVPGPQTIYHRVDDDGAVLVSAANLLRPGDLDPLAMDEQQLRGLSMFSVLPGAMEPVRMLEELVSTARAVSWRLGAVVQDDQGAELDGDRLVKLRQSLPEAAEPGVP
jgi:FtsZ-interacting cell division protein ZipA